MSGPGNTRAHILFDVGRVLLGAGLVIGGPLFGTTVALATLAAGAVLVVIALASAKGEAVAPSFATFTKWGLPVVVTGALWTLSHFATFESDVTKARVNTLAEESLQVAQSLKAPVRVVSFVDERAEVELRALVERYTRAAAAEVTFQPCSLQRPGDVEIARVLGIADLLPLGGPNVVVVAEGGGERAARLRFDAGLADAEERLTNALRQASTATQPRRAYVLDGHGEPRLDDEGAAGLSRLKTDLRVRGVDLIPLSWSLLKEKNVLDDAQLLVVLPGTQAPSAEEEAVVASFSDKGAVWILAEPEAPAFVSSLAGRFGVTLLPGDVVVEEGAFGSLIAADAATGATQLAHPVTRPLKQALTHFPHAAVLSISPIDGVDTQPLVSTAAEAKAQKSSAAGPLPLVVAATIDKERGKQRAIVTADASFVQNASLGLGANRDLAVNLALWLAEDDAHITVHPRQKSGAQIYLTPTGRERLALVVVFVIPLLLACAAAALNASRR